MPTVAFHTLGCKVNQYDSQAMLEVFQQAGYEAADFEGKADVYVINTCTVTGTGDKKSMQAVRRAMKNNPDAQVVIAGCLAQRDGEKLLSTGARLIIGNSRRGEVVKLLHEAMEKGQAICAVQDILRADYEPLFITRQEEHTRAVLKIQEGCDRYCTYCIIPSVRGGIRSRRPEDIRAEAEGLAKAGFKELVLTGIHLTSYGRDLEGKTLLDAVKACDIEGVERIRLGSLEPVIATEDFVRELAKIGKVCPQFHLALQSGSDEVLRRMRRRYTTAEFAAACELLRRYFPGCALTTDVICGFPGETEADFAQSCAFCEKIAFSRLHVFPYSRRQGTKAADMPGQLTRAAKEERTRQLISIGKKTALAYHQSLVGTVQEVLVEEDLSGYTRGYVPCRIAGGENVCRMGDTLKVKVICADENGVTGEMIRE